MDSRESWPTAPSSPCEPDSWPETKSLAARLNLRGNPRPRGQIPPPGGTGFGGPAVICRAAVGTRLRRGSTSSHPGSPHRATGKIFGFFFNDTNQDDWVAYQPWLYEHGHGWAAYGWQPQEPPYWYYVPSGTGINVINQGLQVFSGFNAYLAGAVQVFWYNGARDWNFVNTSHPGNGIDSTVYDSIWCYVP